MNLKVRLAVMNFLEFAVWGAYLTCMGNYLGVAGLGDQISWFYAIQGIVSIFMPTIMGIVADKYIQPQRLLGLCHLVAGTAMLICWWMGVEAGFGQELPNKSAFIAMYTVSVAFFMPTIALANTTAFTILKEKGLDTVKDFCESNQDRSANQLQAQLRRNIQNSVSRKSSEAVSYLQAEIDDKTQGVKQAVDSMVRAYAKQGTSVKVPELRISSLDVGSINMDSVVKEISDQIVENSTPNLILSGNSLGGLINIPFYGPLILPNGSKKYNESYYKINNTEIFISNGIGTDDKPYRFLNKPSFNLYRLKSLK